MIGRWLVAAGLALAAPLAAPSTAFAATPDAAALKQEQDWNLRLWRVTNRIAMANAGRCAATRPAYGYLAISVSDAATPATRDLWREALGLGAQFKVVGLMPDGPAARAGLMAGDLLAVVGQVPWSPELAQRQRFEAALREAQQSGAMRLTVERQGSVVVADLVAQPACAVDVVLIRKAIPNASTFGRRVEVNTGLLQLLDSDDELAFVVGHEMAHAVLDHTGPGKEALARASATRGPMEREADMLGVRMAARAGFDPEAAARAEAKLAHANRGPISRLLDLHGAYMPTRERIAFLQSEAAKAVDEEAGRPKPSR